VNDASAKDGAQRRPRLFVTIGTDHHAFERLVGWVGDWARANPDWDVSLQHGRTAAPPELPNLAAFAFFDHAQLQELLSGSDAIVCHGGPATITEARRSGHVPVVVPRDPVFGEHVDSHQLLFARRLEAAGLITLVTSTSDLAGAVVAARRSPADRTVTARPAEVPPGVHRVGEVAEEVVLAARAARARRS
jgi:UDP-N-acetylglucosamine transferase subunit ALG13